MSDYLQCPSCGQHTEQKLPDGWMKCRCGSEFNYQVREAEEAERARLLDLGGRVPELLAAERALALAEVAPLLSHLHRWRSSVQPKLDHMRASTAEFSLAKFYDAYVKVTTREKTR
jgi:hypothetical protein